jgi:hypothetical protein
VHKLVVNVDGIANDIANAQGGSRVEETIVEYGRQAKLRTDDFGLRNPEMEIDLAQSRKQTWSQ